MTKDGRIEIKLVMDGTRVDGEIDGHKFAIVRRGPVTGLEGIKSDDSVLGSLIGTKLLDACGDIMDGLNIIVDEMDHVDVWATLPESIADDVYEAIS